MDLTVESESPDTSPGDNRPPVYWEGDFLIIRASALGHSCLWELIAAGQGYEPGLLPSNLIRAFREGHTLEPVALGWLQEKGWKVTGTQSQGHLVLDPKLMVRYHPDGLGSNGGLQTVVEVKWLSDALWLAAKENGVGSILNYDWQISVMMHAEGAPGMWVVGNKGLPPDPTTREKPSCERQGHIFTEQVPQPPISYEEIRERALAVREGVLGEDVISSGRECDDPTAWPCRYIHLRPEPEGPPGEAVMVPDSDKEEVDRLLKEFLFHKGQMDENKQRYEAARDRLLAIAGDAESILTDRWLIPITNSRSTWHSFKGAPDEDREVIDKYKQSKPTRYIGKPKPLA